MYQPLVSVIMPAYNAEQYIEQAIESVIFQTYMNWELLITDDQSKDSTQEIIKGYADKDSRIKLFITDENGGAGVARNNSIKQAKGRFIAFLDSDDFWHKDKLTKQISFMLSSDVAFSFTAYQKVNAGELKGTIIPPQSTVYSKLLQGNVIGCLTAIYDAEKLGKNYMPLIRKRQDMGLWLQLLKLTDKAFCLQEVLAFYRIDSGMTQNKLKILKWQWCFYRDVVRLPFFKSLFYFVIYSFKATFKVLK